MKLSVIIPAFNEEKVLPESLSRIREALTELRETSEVIVVDNESTDRTVEISTSFGAIIAKEAVKNIGAVRNSGARSAKGEVYIFIDADTFVPPNLFQVIQEKTNDPTCFGGAVAVDYGTFDRPWLRFMGRAWKFWGPVFNMKQGAAQFCRRSVFEDLAGYDERIFLGEDIDFYWRLTKYAKEKGGTLTYIEDPKVQTSTRRFDKMSVWDTMVLTHPVYILLNWKRKKPWRQWYDGSVR